MDENVIRVTSDYESEIRAIQDALVEEFMDRYIDINTEMDSIAETIIEIFGDMTIDGISEVIVSNERECNRISAYINTKKAPIYYIEYETTPQIRQNI